MKNVKLTADGICVLIETYWNVNMDTEGWQRGLMTVLIETYWNVNHRNALFYPTLERLVLIETYWNVNQERSIK